MVPATLLSFALFVTSVASPLQAEGSANADPLRVREVDAIECRLDVPGYNQFAMAIQGEEEIAKKRGWKKIDSRNPFMNEYELPKPIIVAGSYSTTRIAFTADAILAILDLADPGVIARDAHIENAMNPEPLIADLVASGKVTRVQAEAEIKFRKFLGERILNDVTEPASGGESFGSHMIVARSISNATTHPGKTFYGCAYRMELLDKDGKPL
ncbi:hypothetical protein [Sphingomonas psychrotolerans]|uniref:Uncharacterized protein n=1 Tax=Sphingomonas psychrotolerans TaxID=1327635 RepID=A0A2K8MPM0_9SPHN|nr:hypothetical protein [Sphingomonas psychrotolerans]ATY33371.1 hypothetical protein CVN68_16520 [Sphingomonas psychrotolerans]